MTTPCDSQQKEDNLLNSGLVVKLKQSEKIKKELRRSKGSIKTLEHEVDEDNYCN